MPFTIPNEADAFHADQAEPDKVDVDILVAGLAGNGVVSGCAVTAQGTPDMTVAVAAGVIRNVDGTTATVTAGNVTVGTADATNPRFDLITVGSTGTKACTAGTAAASPVFPAIPAGSVVLAAVYVPANDTAIAANQITDKRVILGDNSARVNKLNGTAAPTANEDSDDGYSVGSVWIDVTGDAAYICVDASSGAAVWLPFDSDPREFPAAWTLDDIALGGGVLFDEAAGVPTGMTAQGLVAADYASMPGLDVLCDAGDLLHIPDPGGDLEAMIHFSDTYSNQGMFGIGFVDASGNGHCFVRYNNNLHRMNASGWVYSGTGTLVANVGPDFENTFGHQWIAVKRVGTTLTARISLDGISFSSATAGVANSTSTRIAVGRWYGSNGGKPVRLHRLTLAAPDLGV